MKRINNLLSRRWITIYSGALYLTMLGVGLGVAGRWLFAYPLIGVGVAAMFYLLILSEWRGE